MNLKVRIFLLALCLGGAVPAGASPTTTPRIVAAANAFLATLDDAKKSVVLFERGNTAQKQRWSNLPDGVFKRAGLRWADLDEAQRAAWLEVMQITLSAEGYGRVLDEWRADDALAGGITAKAKHAQGHRPVETPGIHVRQAKVTGKCPGNGTFAAGCRAIDGNQDRAID